MKRFFLVLLMLVAYVSNAEETLESLKNTAVQGDAMAQLKLGGIYTIGEGC